MDHVLLQFERDRGLAYLSRALGITFNTRITFDQIPEGDTEIRAFLKLEGTPRRAFDFAIESTIAKVTRRFLQGLKTDSEWETFREQQRSRSGLV